MNAKFKYGETFLKALLVRSFEAMFRLTHEPKFFIKSAAGLMFFLWVLTDILLFPFSRSDRRVVQQYLMNRYQYKEKFSYFDLLEFHRNKRLKFQLDRVVRESRHRE